MSETRSILKLSTAHMTRETAQLLDTTPLKDWPVFGARFEDGFGYLINRDEDITEPEDLVAIIAHAQSEMDFIWLDPDFPAIPDLPTYDW